MLKHRWILEPANEHFAQPFCWPCHAWIGEVMAHGLSWRGVAEYAEPTTRTAFDIRRAMAWYRSTGWLLEPAKQHFSHGLGDETASAYVARLREGEGWSWQQVSADMCSDTARSASALRAAVKRLETECREAESDAM